MGERSETHRFALHVEMMGFASLYPYEPTVGQKNPGALIARRALRRHRSHKYNYDAAALGMRLRELRWKNNAWLATAETIAGWNGFEIRNAGSGRSPVRNRSG
jgi:hypothetical protein